MSADTTVVIGARRQNDGELAYTAAVVQAAENIYGGSDEFCVRWAHACFLNRQREWFTGKGGLARAKQFANLLAQEYRENFVLEYEDRPIIEIGDDRIYLLSRKGNRLPEGDIHRAQLRGVLLVVAHENAQMEGYR